jgi:hypothetical protein
MFLWLQLKRLSWSWSHEINSYKSSFYSDIKSISPQLGHIEFLLIYVKTADFTYAGADILCAWLVWCTALKELWVRNHWICSCLPEKFISDSYSYSKNWLHFIEPRCALPSSQEPATGLFLEPNEFAWHSPTLPLFKTHFFLLTFVIIWGSYCLTADHLWSRCQFFVCTLFGCNATAITALPSSSVFCLSALNRLISQFIFYYLFGHNATVQSLYCPLLVSFHCLHWIDS